jgi:hypothetical protein
MHASIVPMRLPSWPKCDVLLKLIGKSETEGSISVPS